MKKSYAYLFLFIFTLGSTFTIVSCSDDDDYTPIEDVLPIATDDFATYPLAESVEIPVLENDITGDEVIPTTVSIVGGVDTDSNGTLDKLDVANEGIWTVNALSGNITFTPSESFIGNPTVIKYTVEDLEGNVSNQANVTITAVSIAVVDLTQVPYPKLSDYKFFVGDIKNQNPSYGVLPYKPASSLFTDYALKARFVWMPDGTTATYNGDENNLELPVGAVLIKNFYYNNVQPSNTTRIIETRLMIRKSEGWIFAEYVWNNEQTEAFLQTGGSLTSITWLNQNGVSQTVSNYRIPSEVECLTCHKQEVNPIPIGIKPQNLNTIYNYQTGMQNQLAKWIEMGYLQDNLPNTIASAVDYNDTSKSLDLRVRSYLDINCAHCHSEMGHCNYRDIRLDFVDTTIPANLGICVPPVQPVDGATSIVEPGNPARSALHGRMNTNEANLMMPLVGRSVIHEEGVQLIQDWINSLNGCN
ncbi:MAG TPA: hypothetical protein PLL09_11265 [Flavobacterium sp.]|uniref:Ig-like domain-containing protein n=1 Tax=unclassified Flavobacterium TaxID=196869 RepID=UPI0025BB09F5|nr:MULTISPECIES: hypothetical protein [unclassified Flavobacterium]HRE78391.1 hypothetical protein [Flavobacterium sp.]